MLFRFSTPGGVNPLGMRYYLSLIPTLHHCMGGGGQKYFLFLETTHLQWKEHWQHISILGWIAKSEDPLALSSLKVLASYNNFVLVQPSEKYTGCTRIKFYCMRIYNLTTCWSKTGEKNVVILHIYGAKAIFLLFCEYKDTKSE